MSASQEELCPSELAVANAPVWLALRRQTTSISETKKFNCIKQQRYNNYNNHDNYIKTS
jgi:hypothetical protein